LDLISSYLREIGLSEDELKVYHILVSRGEKQAGQISQLLSIPRVRMYRLLSSLENRGLVKASISRPMLFSAVPPNILLKDSRNVVLSRMQMLNDLGQSLSDLLLNSVNVSQPEKFEGFNFQIVDRKETVLRRLRDLFSSSSEGLELLISPENLHAIFNQPLGSVYFSHLKSSKSVRILLHSEVRVNEDILSDSPASEVLTRIRAEKHFVINWIEDSLDFQLAIRSKKQVMIMTKNLQKALCSSNPILVEISENCFENLWKQYLLSSSNLTEDPVSIQ
jgi:sugar-specific transcriptional regulator TrmB